MKHMIRGLRGLGQFNVDIGSSVSVPDTGLVSGQVVTSTVQSVETATPGAPTRIYGTDMRSGEAAADYGVLQQALQDAVGSSASLAYVGLTSSRAQPSSVEVATDEELAALDSAIGGAQRETTAPAVTAPPTGYASVDGELEAPVSPTSRHTGNGMIFGLKPWQAALLAGGLLVGGILLMRR